MLEDILEALPSSVFVKGEGHRWVLLNDSYCSFTGLARERLLGKTYHDLFPQNEADVFQRRDDTLFANGRLCETEERVSDGAARAKVILTRKTLHSVSGYAHDIISKAGVRDSGIEVPRRLFATARLQERVRKVLDSDG